MSFRELWNDKITIELWKMILIGLFFFVMNLTIFIAMWYVRQGVICEYGYPKRNRRSLKKKIATYSILGKLSLVCLTREAERKGPLLYITVICHYICAVALCISCFGFTGCLFTLADGWALTLLVISELLALFFTVLIEFIPHLIWLPSERKRYSRKKR